MPRAKQEIDPRQPPIQYRAGPLLGRWIAEYTAAWHTNDNEAARRLAALAACRLDISCYKLLVQLAEALAPLGGKPDFIQACDHIRTAIDSGNRARMALEKQVLCEAETVVFIQQTVAAAVRARRTKRLQAQQHEIKVTVHRTG
jgi:hypothetical protein